jgi:hypothetical protein
MIELPDTPRMVGKGKCWHRQGVLDSSYPHGSKRLLRRVELQADVINVRYCLSQVQLAGMTFRD